MDDPSFYGFPTFGRPGVKIAQDCGGLPVDPDTRGFDPDPAILARTDAFATRRSAGASARRCRTTTCLYTLHTGPRLRRRLAARASQRPRRPRRRPRLQVRRLVRADDGRAGRRRPDPGCDLTPFRLDRPALTDPTWEPNWLV